MSTQKASRTFNPLPFEHLEPKRFEDLVRQLVYDFRNWRMLEATGRSGSDDGFDARGWEILSDEEVVTEEDDDKNEEKIDVAADRLWLVQCKREKSITPKKIEKYADEILAQNKNLYGVIFVAPCDFSKKTRDAFRNKLREVGIEEVHMWSKGELEDLLYQPKNDHLLFAYFGFSLQIRRRSVKTKLRSLLSIKRKAIRVLGGIEGKHYKEVLIRDANDEHYPHDDEIPDFDKNPRWRNYYFLGHYHSGIIILIKKYYGYADDQDEKWDYCEKIELGRPHPHNDYWAKDEDAPYDYDASSFWNDIPEQNRYWFQVVRAIPYEKILDIDADGDQLAKHPHVYVDYSAEDGPFMPGIFTSLQPCAQWGASSIANPEIKDRIKFFPDKFPDARAKQKAKEEEEKRKNESKPS